MRRIIRGARRKGCQEARRNISGPAEEIRIPVPYGHIAGKAWGDPQGKPILGGKSRGRTYQDPWEVVTCICSLGLHGWLDNAGTHDGLAVRLPEGYRLVGSTPAPYTLHPVPYTRPRGEYKS